MMSPTRLLILGPALSDYDRLQELIEAMPDSDDEFETLEVRTRHGPHAPTTSEIKSDPEDANLSEESDLQPQPYPDQQGLSSSRCHQLMAMAYQSPGRIFSHVDDTNFHIDNVAKIMLQATCIAYVLADNGLVTMPPTVPILVHTVKPKKSNTTQRPTEEDDDRTTDDSSATEEEPAPTPIILRETVVAEGHPACRYSNSRNFQLYHSGICS